jgi:hypothetical protein
MFIADLERKPSFSRQPYFVREGHKEKGWKGFACRTSTIAF